MKTRIVLALTLWGAGLTAAHADATLVYELKAPDSDAVQKSLYASRFFVRVESSDDQDRYLLFQAGKFFPLYSVDLKERTFTRLTPPVTPSLGPVRHKEAPVAHPSAEVEAEASEAEISAEPSPEAIETAPKTESPTTEAEDESSEEAEADETGETPHERGANTQAQGSQSPPKLPRAPQFKPSRKTEMIAGVRCRIVLELIDGEPAIEHCMASKATLGITDREMRSLARLFVMARERDLDWLGAATEDEQFISVRSRDIRRRKTLSLQSVSTKPLPFGYLRVPKDFVEVKLDWSGQAGGSSTTSETHPVAPIEPGSAAPAGAAAEAAGPGSEAQ